MLHDGKSFVTKAFVRPSQITAEYVQERYQFDADSSRTTTEWNECAHDNGRLQSEQSCCHGRESRMEGQ